IRLHGAGAVHHVEAVFSHFRHVGRHDAVAALRHYRNLGPARVWRHAKPERADAEGPCHFLDLREMRHQLGAGLMHGFDRRAGKLELSARLERDRAASGHVEQADDVAGLDDRFPTEQMLHAFEQCADAAAAFVWDRVVAFQREPNLLVLGAESETRVGLAARLEPRDEILARFDRSHVDLVASHAGFRRKGPRPYTAPAREGNWVTPRMQNSGVRLSPY